LLNRLLSLAVLAAFSGSPVGAADSGDLIADTLEAATACTLSAAKSGVDEKRFKENPKWRPRERAKATVMQICQ
jgi:hypothetical protein